jgi:FkbM family methyltransferase
MSAEAASPLPTPPSPPRMFDRLARLYFARFPVERGKWRIWCQVRRHLGPRTEPGLTMLGNGLKLWIDPADYIGQFIFYWECWEPNETWALRRLLRPGDVFVDVGAHIGWFTLNAARIVGPAGHVVAVEATPPTFDILRANIAANGLTNITTLACAVADVEGSVRINRAHGANCGMNSLRPGAGASGKGWTVPARRLDDLLADHPKIRLVKMDIEGAEAMALRGMTETLSRAQAPDVLCEITGGFLRDLGSEPAEIFDLFRRTGHTPFLLDNLRFTPMGDRRFEDRDSINVLFTRHPETLARSLG